MGGGGYADKPAGPLKLQQKVVEAYAYGDIDFGALPDLAMLPNVDDAFNTAVYGFAEDGFDWSADAAAPAAVPAFGSLAVDALFGKSTASPARAPASPVKATAPGSVPASPMRAAAAGAAPAPAPVVQSTPILTSHASADINNVVVVRAPKRAAEQPALPRQHARGWDAASDVSDNELATLEADDIRPAPLVAQRFACQQEVVAALPEMETQQRTHDGEIVTLSPTLWRSTSPPVRIHVNVGLRTMRVAEAEAPATFFGSLHPRIITTGVPHRRLGHAHPRSQPDAPAPPVTRSARTHGALVPERVASADPGGFARRGQIDHATCHLQEVWLLQKSGRCREVMAAHQCTGPFDGTTLPSTVDWPGDVTVDIAVCVDAPGTGSFWIKACGRVPLAFEVQEAS